MNELGYDTENLFPGDSVKCRCNEKLRDQELNNGLLEKEKRTNQRQKMKLILSMPIRKIPGFQYSMN